MAAKSDEQGANVSQYVEVCRKRGGPAKVAGASCGIANDPFVLHLLV